CQGLSSAASSEVANITTKLCRAPEKLVSDLFVLIIESELRHRHAHCGARSEQPEPGYSRSQTTTTLHHLRACHRIAPRPHLSEVGFEVGKSLDRGVGELAKRISVAEQICSFRPVEVGQQSFSDRRCVSRKSFAYVGQRDDRIAPFLPHQITDFGALESPDAHCLSELSAQSP